MNENEPQQTIRLWMSEHGDMVRRTIYVITQDLETSEDLAQETFVKAFRKLHQFNARSRPQTWLYRIAVNTARNHLRRVRPKNVPLDAVAHTLHSDDRWCAVQRLEREHDAAEIRRTVATLPSELRTVVALYYVDGFGVSEVAEITGVPLGTVKSRLSRARDHLRVSLSRITRN
ncbi:MAG: RNA polymerase sigma factor [Spirochaetota bacterium]